MTYCTPRERKYGKPNSISYGVKGSYEYDVDEEKITDIVDEGKNKIVVHTYREEPMQEKMQYIFLLKKANGFWILRKDILHGSKNGYLFPYKLYW